MVALARKGMTAPQIGAEVGLAGSTVRNWLLAAGRPISTLRSERCIECGKPIPGCLRPGARCPACRRNHNLVYALAYRRLKPAALEKARCHHCGAELTRYASP